MLNWFSAKYKTSKFMTKVDKSCMESCEEIEAIVTKNGANKPAKYTLSGRLGPGGKARVKLYKFLKRERLSLLWKWCKSCNNFCPPRAHHCKVQATIHFRECQINELKNKTDQSYTYMLKFYLLAGLFNFSLKYCIIFLSDLQGVYFEKRSSLFLLKHLYWILQSKTLCHGLLLHNGRFCQRTCARIIFCLQSCLATSRVIHIFLTIHHYPVDG